ncbi:MAG: alpha/beta hydrolase [Pseudomonadota bacterium]|nr:alpha/beta hydrolase [Pseudomonadota bacterium]
MKYTFKALLVTIFFLPCAYLSATTEKTPISKSVIEEFKSDFSSQDIGKLRTIYKKYLLQANYPIGDIDRDISYGEHPLQKLDIHHNQSTTEKSPVVIFIHGGAFVRGDKSDHVIFDNVLNYFARNGVTGINANYRLAPDYMWPSGSKDVAKVIKWVRSNAKSLNIDKNNIFLMGHSAGAAHVATYSFNEKLQVDNGNDGVKGSILLSGIYSNVSKTSKENYYGFNKNNMPIDFINGRSVPLFIIDAEYDKQSTQVEAIELIQKLCQNQAKCPNHKQIPGHNHYSMMYHFNTNDDSIARDILDFINNKKVH